MVCGWTSAATPRLTLMSGSSPRYFVIEVRSACDLKDVQAFGSQVRWAAFCAFPLTPPAMRALQDPYVLAYPFPDGCIGLV